MSKLAVLGHPVAHSRSPAMHNAALAAMGLDGWRYEAIEVPPDDFAAQTAALAGKGFVGANVTIPHKGMALRIAHDVSPAAAEIGAANTLTFMRGEIRADNTDAPGLLAALSEPVARKRALVLGAGGAARAAVWALSRQGARVDVWNRTASRADELVQEFGVSALHGERPGAVSGYELIVNATPLGLEPGDEQLAELGIDPGMIGAGQVVVDLAYGEEETEFVRVGHRSGATVVDGLEVLAHQGAESLRIWTGREPPLDVMRQAARHG